MRSGKGRTTMIFCFYRVCSRIQTRYLHSLSQDILATRMDNDVFLSWLQTRAGVNVCSPLHIGTSSYGRSVYTVSPIHAGDCIMRIPHNLLITADKLQVETEPFLGKDVSNYARLALFILAEKKLYQRSLWAPYILSLPQAGSLNSTVFWSEEELKMIKPSGVYHETLRRKQTIRREFYAFQKVSNHFSHIFGDISFYNFMHAYALVSSRAWEISSRGLALVPFADFLNHDGLSTTVLLTDDDQCFSEVIADRDYAIGEQVFISYGQFSNGTLLLDFGFTLPSNPYDQVEIWMCLSPTDPLYKSKLRLLHMHNMPTLLDMDGSDMGGNYFTIKEVKSSTGRGKEIPHSLRAFARVICSSSPRELEDMAIEAQQYDGRLARKPSKENGKELEAMTLLLKCIDSLIQQHETFILSLQDMESYKGEENRSHIRHALSLNLLKGELCIMHSASAWLKHYCTSLSLTEHI